MICSNPGILDGGFSGGSDSKESACKAGDPGSIPGQEDALEKRMATHSERVRVYSFSRVQLFATPQTAAHQDLCPWYLSGKNIEVGCQFFPTQELNPSLLHCRQILYHVSYQGNPTYSSILDILAFLHVNIFLGELKKFNFTLASSLLPQGQKKRQRSFFCF